MSYSDISGHYSMVFDGLRNAVYARAMAEVIQPGTTVMDLGAGLGVHGLNAAKMGAAAVHLVEPAPVLEVARKIAKDNGLQNVHCHNCRAEELELESKVDVLVSVFTGNFLLTEDLLPSLFDTRDRFLAPGGTMIPDRARMEVVPVSAPSYYQKHIDGWSLNAEHAGAHGPPPLDYRSVRPYVANTMYYESRKKFDATPLAAASVLMELDFITATSASCDNRTEVTIDQEGDCHGWLGWFQMRLGDEWLSTSGEPEPTHWSPVFLPLEKPIKIKAGEQLGFALKRPEHGDWTWTTEHKGQRQRQSTFLSQPISPERLQKASENYKPTLSKKGEAAQLALGRMDGELPIVQIAAEVLERFPELFKSEAEASKFVKDLGGRYS